MKITVDPVAKPRMTRSDKWKLRPIVIKYRLFKDALRREAPELQNSLDDVVWLVFVVPMPESWSQKKKKAMLGKPHQQTPDRDNFEKAFLDATMKEDKAVYEGHTLKIWGSEGAIYYGKEDYARISKTIKVEKKKPSTTTQTEEARTRIAREFRKGRNIRMRGVLPRTQGRQKA